ncbi:hypothetical protein FACS1894120_4840 [Clostridia bacterium]|nr:hypothetical protein FACS1894120_4840 [Clostridia bacterium]
MKKIISILTAAFVIISFQLAVSAEQGATGSALPSGRVGATGIAALGVPENSQGLPGSPVAQSGAALSRVLPDEYVKAVAAEDFVYLADRLNPDGTVPPDAKQVVVNGSGKVITVPPALNIEKVYSNRAGQVSHIYIMTDVAGGKHGLLKSNGQFLGGKAYDYVGVYGNYAVTVAGNKLSVVNSKTEKSVMTYTAPSGTAIKSIGAQKIGDYHQFSLYNGDGEVLLTHTVTLKWKNAGLDDDISLADYDKTTNRYTAWGLWNNSDAIPAKYVLDKNLKIISTDNSTDYVPLPDGITYLNTRVQFVTDGGKDYIYVYRLGGTDKLVKKIEGKGTASSVAVTKNKVFIAVKSGGFVFDAKTVKYKSIKGSFSSVATISASADTVIFTKSGKSGGSVLADKNGKIYTKTFGAIAPVSTFELAMGDKKSGFKLYGLSGKVLFTPVNKTSEFVKLGHILAAHKVGSKGWDLYHSVSGKYRKFATVNGDKYDNASALVMTGSGSYLLLMHDSGSKKFGLSKIVVET